MDVVRSIMAFNAGRESERLQLKYSKLRSSTFAFLRGTCHLFYAQLPQAGVFKSAPLAWACGDLHLENFGSYKADNRLVQFDINDFDEAALARASWDLLRSAGRQGSACADALIDFGRDTTWQTPLQAATQDCAEQVRQDANVYNAAFDDHALSA